MLSNFRRAILTSCRYLSILCGYILAKKGLFPPAASKGASQVTMNVSLPLLVFANIVPAFTQQNISALGPLFLTAFVYMALGFIFGAIIREVCYVPRNFWQGIIVLTGMSNWGNLRELTCFSSRPSCDLTVNFHSERGRVVRHSASSIQSSYRSTAYVLQNWR